ncbi:MAG: calcium/sodium antiporter [Lachnospiraceae bacterium]|nr:calcium/sodium antiporter [Lachnospiraceae bacterium]MDD7667972.1 calcium/sodium antiporter [Lachnospiraceae bacterium]MDY2619150.1 calcium/sodium antiporter [Agathobacter sp.]
MTEFITNCALPLAILFLVIGFVFLVKGADIFVEGSSSIAKKFKVPSIIIGLTIVAMGTSLPEAAVSVTASIANKNALAVSNVIGSNIFNLMMVIGVCAIMTPVAVNKATLKRDFPFSVICAILLLVLGLIGPMSLGHADGVIFLILFAGFIGLMIRSAMKASKEGNAVASEEIEAAEEIKIMPVWKSLLFIVIGAVGIIIGGDVVVDSASNIAAKFGMSQTLIGLTIVSVGTSLPELVTSIVAARKNEVDMALGNAIGSNVFNILFVLGIAGAISPMAFLTENVIDIVILVVFSLIVWLFAWTKKEIKRGEGLIMVLLYVLYVVYICMR